MPGHEAEGEHLEDAAERLVGLAGDVDLLDHRRRRVRVEAAHRGLVDALEVRHRQALALGRRDRADALDVAADLDPEGAQQRLGQAAGGHSRGRLACAGALEHVAHVLEAVLLHPGEVGVTGARQVHLGHLGLDRPGVHPLLPVGVVAVDDAQGDGAAERAAVAHAGGDLGAVLLDLHTPAAAMAELATGEVGVDVLGTQLEAGRQALDDRGQPWTVGLAGGDEAKRHGVHTLLTRAWTPSRSRRLVAARPS